MLQLFSLYGRVVGEKGGKMIKRFNHVGIAVYNLEESLKFYCDVLGFKQDGEISPVCSDPVELNAMGIGEGNSYRQVCVVTPAGDVIEMFDFEKNTEPNVVDLTPNSVGKLHLAFTVDDIKEETAKLEAHGIKFYSEPQMDFMGPWVYFEDPNGITLEFVESV